MMSKIVIVILLYHRHRPIGLIAVIYVSLFHDSFLPKHYKGLLYFSGI
jgi:hypothetical protein